MARGGGSDLRVKGLGLRPRFVLQMTLALTGVVIAAGLMLVVGAGRVSESSRVDELVRAVRASYDQPTFEARGETHHEHASGVRIYPVVYGPRDRPGTLYIYDERDDARPAYRLILPDGSGGGGALVGLVIATMIVVVVVGALVASWVAGQVTRPVLQIVDDVRTISKGELRRPIRVSGGGEIELLARSIERMTRDLEAAQTAELELSVRQRELSLAGDVREALLPVATPLVEGWDVAAVHLGSGAIGGDFHDYVELDDGRLGLLVCDVGGTGVPAALIGATARSYLRSELRHVPREGGTEALREALVRVNRYLGDDVRRGAYVTALYVLLDPDEARAAVACAGHKIPLLRYAGADGTLRQVHPDGIALGLDRGPVFERRLEVAQVPVEPGDRLFLCNSGPVRLVDGQGRELGERAFFGRVLKHAPLESFTFLKALRADLDRFAGEAGVPHDVSLVTVARLAGGGPEGE